MTISASKPTVEKVHYNIKSFTTAPLFDEKYPLLHHFQVFKNLKLFDNMLEELIHYKQECDGNKYITYKN